MNNTQYQTQFQAFGKVIKFSNLIDTNSDEFKAEADDMTVKMSDSYDVIANPLPLAINMTKQVISNLSSQKSSALNVISNYLTNITKSDILSTSNTVSGIIDDLITDMNSESQTVALSGVFYNYFNTNYSKQLNAVDDASETILDSWAE